MRHLLARATPATGSQLRSSAMLCGSTFASRSACAWWTSCWPRGIIVSHETVRQWALKFGQVFANLIRRRLPTAGDKWHLDEVVLMIAGQRVAWSRHAGALAPTPFGIRRCGRRSGVRAPACG